MFLVMFDAALWVAEVNEEVVTIITDFNLSGLADKLILDFHIMSFPPGSG